jgi:hypothetical protein
VQSRARIGFFRFAPVTFHLRPQSILGVAFNGESINNSARKMPSPNPDETLLLIRCPSCGQRFKVGEDLRGRTVECGGCENRFRIGDDVIVRGRKFYPGERKDPTLNRFQRVPLAIAPSTKAVPSVRYTDPPDPKSFEPTPPQRILAGIAGVVIMVCIALLLMFSSHRGGTLDGMTTENRLLMAGFTGFLGLLLLVYANPRARLKAAVVGFVFTTGLLALPFFFTVGSVPLKDLPQASAGTPTSTKTPEDDRDASPATVKATSENKTTQDLRALIGTRPLEDEIQRLADEGSGKHALGIWFRDLREQNRFLVRDYIIRTTGADPQTHFFPRGGGDFLMVVTGINESIEELVEISAPLGSVEKIHSEISVIEIKVNNESFVEGSIEKLNDREDPAFYNLNLRELQSIDLERVSKAVKRLADAEPKLLRSDITRKLISLLGADWVSFKEDVCKALSVWSETPGPAGDAALDEARKLLAAKKQIPVEMIALIVKEKNILVIPVIDQLWSDNPTHWESLYADVGPAAETTLLRRFPTTEGALRQSVVRLLGKLGGEDSLPFLESANASADPELKVLIEKATASIRSRMAR